MFYFETSSTDNVYTSITIIILSCQIRFMFTQITKLILSV